MISLLLLWLWRRELARREAVEEQYAHFYARLGAMTQWQSERLAEIETRHRVNEGRLTRIEYIRTAGYRPHFSEN